MNRSRRSLIAGILGAGVIAVLMISSIGAAPAPPAQTQILNNQDVGKAETAVGNLVADAFRSAAHADAAFVSAGDLKPLSSSVTGAIKATDLTALLMYPGDTVVTMALDGLMIRQALETSVSGYAQPSLSFLQVSGVKFTFDPSRPSGQRVTNVTIGGSSIVKDKSYTVAMMNSMAGGALGYWKVWSKRNIVSGVDPITSAAAVENYVKTNPKPDLTAQGRINVSK